MTRSVKTLARRITEAIDDPEGQEREFPQFPPDLRAMIDEFYDRVTKDLPERKSARLMLDDSFVQVQLRWDLHNGSRLYVLKLTLLSALTHLPPEQLGAMMEGETVYQKSFVRQRFGLADSNDAIKSSAQLEAAFAWSVPA